MVGGAHPGTDTFNEIHRVMAPNIFVLFGRDDGGLNDKSMTNCFPIKQQSIFNKLTLCLFSKYTLMFAAYQCESYRVCLAISI